MNTEYFFETDIACENERSDRRGKMENTFCESGMRITKTTFDPLVKNGLLPRDVYYGIYCGPIWRFDEETALSASAKCAEKLSLMLKELTRRDGTSSVLAVGIGNRSAAPDMLGPLCCDRITAQTDTRIGLPRISVISPGVPLQTGIDTAQYTRALAKETGADVIIAIDSLSTNSTDRLGAFIQIGNCGITPGAGTAKRGKGISFSTMGIPVISIGIPTVIRAAALVGEFDASRRAYECPSALCGLSVTPQYCNAVTEIGASVISRAINACLSSPQLF